MANSKKPENSESPCASCTTNRDPSECENKSCKRWRAWFAESWDHWTALLRQHLKEGSDEGGEES